MDGAKIAASLLAGLCLFLTVSAGQTLAEEPAPELLRTQLSAYSHRVVCESVRDGNWELYLMNADGTNPVNLTRTPDVDEPQRRMERQQRFLNDRADAALGAERREIARHAVADIYHRRDRRRACRRTVRIEERAADGPRRRHDVPRGELEQRRLRLIELVLGAERRDIIRRHG